MWLLYYCSYSNLNLDQLRWELFIKTAMIKESLWWSLLKTTIRYSTTGDCTFNFIRLRLVALNPIIYSILLWSEHQIESCLTFRAKRFKIKGLHLLYASLVHCFELKLLQIFNYFYFSAEIICLNEYHFPFMIAQFI